MEINYLGSFVHFTLEIQFFVCFPVKLVHLKFLECFYIKFRIYFLF